MKNWPEYLYVVKSANCFYITNKPGNIKQLCGTLKLKKVMSDEEEVALLKSLYRICGVNFCNLSTIAESFDVCKNFIIEEQKVGSTRAYVISNPVDNTEMKIGLIRKLFAEYEVIALDTINEQTKQISKKAKETRDFYKNICKQTDLFNKITHSYVVINDKAIKKIINAELKKMGITNLSLDKKIVYVE